MSENSVTIIRCVFAWNITKQGQPIILFNSRFIFNLNGWIINKGHSLKTYTRCH